MGDKTQLKNMINRCRSNGIRIYSEVVINHMCTDGNDMYENHINNDCSSWGKKTGSSGSPFWTGKGLNKNNMYTGLKPVHEFPAVPYFASDFHCKPKDPDYLSINGSNFIWIANLVDLNTEKEYVQQRISDFLTELMSIGISGFSINAALYVSPDNYISIFKKLKNNLGGNFPYDFFAYLYFIMDNEREKEMILCNNDNFGESFVEKMQNEGFNDNDIDKIKISGENYIGNVFPVCSNDGIWKVSEQRYVLKLLNQDIQDPERNDTYIKYKNLIQHQENYIKMLNDSNRDCKIKVIFSSYSLMNISKGIPDGKSDCKKCKNEVCKQECKNSVPYQKAYNPLSIGYDSGDENNWKEGTYTRIHRSIDIVNSMRKWMGFNIYTENQLFGKERLKADCNDSCLICNDESKKLNLCIYCNIDKGFYPIFYGNIYERYHECIYNESNIERLYFDSEDNYFKPCYETCRTCIKQGNETNHNCLSCDINHIFRPEDLYKNNCVLNCTFHYYFNAFGQYKCTDTQECPKEANLLIKEKNKCINDCQKDNIYKYEYNGYCLEDCPTNTEKENHLCKDIYIPQDSYISSIIISDSFIYKDNYTSSFPSTPSIPSITSVSSIPTDKYIIDEKSIPTYSYILSDLYTSSNKSIDKECTLTTQELELKKFYNNKNIESLVKVYSNEYSYTDNHISQYKNEEYNIIIYKNQDCIVNLNLDLPEIDFGSCYTKTQNYYSINNSLIIVTVDKYLHKNNPYTTNSFFNPNTTEKLESEVLCKDDPITIKENLTLFIKNDNNYELILYLMNQGINIFNSSDSFYTDICFDFDFPLNKDITLKDRLLLFYPNISLCDNGCKNIGINLTLMTAICECYFVDIINNELIQDNIIISNFVNEFYEIISESNLEVVKCYKYIFKYFTKLYGGYIVLVLVFNQIILTLYYCNKNVFNIKKYIFNITHNYIEYLKRKKNSDNKIINNIYNNKITINNKNIKSAINFKKEKKTSCYNLESTLKFNRKSNFYQTAKEKMTIKNNSGYSNRKKSDNTLISLNRSSLNSKENIKFISLYNNIAKIKSNKSKKLEKTKINFTEYLASSVDDLDYDDAIKKDNRKFCNYFYELIKEKQITANAFFTKDPLKPKAIKIMFFNLNIIIYFVINGLFFNENYISKIYNSNEEEKFLTFLPRSINRLVYTTFASFVFNIIVECFEVEEKKIKGIFIREKNNLSNLKYEIILLIKLINRRYILFIILAFFIFLISFYYLLCFNYVYPNVQIEWIKSSIVVMILMQIVSILTLFLETLLRYMSFFLKSEKLYKISKLLE